MFTLEFKKATTPIDILRWVGEKYEELTCPDTLKKTSRTQDILPAVSFSYSSSCIWPSIIM